MGKTHEHGHTQMYISCIVGVLCAVMYYHVLCMYERVW